MSLAKHISAFTNVIGTDFPDIAFAFGMVDWESDNDRNDFIRELVTLNDNERINPRA